MRQRQTIIWMIGVLVHCVLCMHSFHWQYRVFWFAVVIEINGQNSVQNSFVTYLLDSYVSYVCEQRHGAVAAIPIVYSLLIQNNGQLECKEYMEGNERERKRNAERRLLRQSERE